MALYRKKPVYVEAIEYTGNNRAEVLNFIGDGREFICKRANELYLYLNEEAGDTLIPKGYYIIRGMDGEFYKCKPEVFASNYERIGR